MSSQRERKGGVAPPEWAKHLRPTGKRRHNKAVRRDQPARIAQELGQKKHIRERRTSCRKPYVVQYWNDWFESDPRWGNWSRHRTLRQAEESLKAICKSHWRKADKFRIRRDHTKTHRQVLPAGAKDE